MCSNLSYAQGTPGNSTKIVLDVNKDARPKYKQRNGENKNMAACNTRINLKICQSHIHSLVKWCVFLSPALWVSFQSQRRDSSKKIKNTHTRTMSRTNHFIYRSDETANAYVEQRSKNPIKNQISQRPRVPWSLSSGIMLWLVFRRYAAVCKALHIRFETGTAQWIPLID